MKSTDKINVCSYHSLHIHSDHSRSMCPLFQMKQLCYPVVHCPCHRAPLHQIQSQSLLRHSNWALYLCSSLFFYFLFDFFFHLPFFFLDVHLCIVHTKNYKINIIIVAIIICCWKKSFLTVLYYIIINVILIFSLIAVVMVKYHVYANKTHMHCAWCQEWIMYNNTGPAGQCFFHLPFLLDVHLCIVQYN